VEYSLCPLKVYQSQSVMQSVVAVSVAV